MMGIFLLRLALAGDPPGLLDCHGTAAPLVWSDLSDEPTPALTTTRQEPSLSTVARRAPFVAVDVDGQLSAPLPEGPVLVSIDPELPGPLIAELYDRFVTAKSEPYEVFVAPRGMPEGALLPDDWAQWPLPSRNDDRRTSPVDVWTETLRDCKAGKRLLKASCEQRAARWEAVIADPRCGRLWEPIDASVYQPKPGALRLVPLPVDPRVVTHEVTEATRWKELSARPPRAVALVSLPPPPPPLAEGEEHVHSRELEVKRRTTPAFPPHARGLGLETPACAVLVSIDDRGVPTAVHEVRHCPTIFHEVATEAVLEWRWYPPRSRAGRRPVRTMIRVPFDDEPQP